MGLRKEDEIIIDKKNGKIKPLYGTDSFSFEAIEDIYYRIVPLLKKRRKAGIQEGANETR